MKNKSINMKLYYYKSINSKKLKSFTTAILVCVAFVIAALTMFWIDANVITLIQFSYTGSANLPAFIIMLAFSIGCSFIGGKAIDKLFLKDVTIQMIDDCSFELSINNQNIIFCKNDIENVVDANGEYIVFIKKGSQSYIFSEQLSMPCARKLKKWINQFELKK